MSAAIGVGEVGTSRWIPAAVSVAVGGTVSWSWSGTSQFHNVFGIDFPLSSDPAKSGSFAHTFGAPGVYHFTCDVHPDTMRGTVTVQ